MSGRRAGAWAVGGVVAIVAALAVGIASAPDDSAPAAPEADGPGAIELPELGRAAAIPALRELPASPEPESAASSAGDSGGSAGTGSAGGTPSASPNVVPTPSPTPTPAPSGGGTGGGGSGGGGGGTGGDDVVGEGL